MNIHLFNYLLSTPKQVSMLAVMYDEGADDGARAKARRTFGEVFNSPVSHLNLNFSVATYHHSEKY